MVKVASIINIIKDLKPGQQKTMRSHARHHSLKHMKAMATDMKKLSGLKGSKRSRRASLLKRISDLYKAGKKIPLSLLRERDKL